MALLCQPILHYVNVYLLMVPTEWCCIPNATYCVLFLNLCNKIFISVSFNYAFFGSSQLILELEPCYISYKSIIMSIIV